MSHRWSACIVWLGLITACPLIATAENWSGWRGPRGDGTSSETELPTRWDGITGQGIAWKVAVPGEGHASPVVWEDSLFLVTCLPDTLERVLLCYDRRSGALRWQQSVVKSPLETKHSLNSYASSTPATDGKLVYVSFLENDGQKVVATNVSKPREVNIGQMVVAAYDFQGHQKWIARPGEFVSVHGFCSPPVLVDDLVIVNGDHDGNSYIAALEKATGKLVWKQPRPHKTRSYAVPLLRTIDGRQQLVFSGNKSIVSLDPKTGEPHWVIDGPTEQFVASMVYDGRQFYMSAGFPTHHVMAIRPDGKGNVTASHVAWHVTNAKCYVPSPVVQGNFLIVADDRGTVNCYDTATGERWWQERVGSHYSASLLAAAGKVWLIADDGVTKIIEPGKTLQVVAENPLGETTYASPAISQGHLYVRGEKHLYRIGPAVP